ncbi:hypothetical protein MT418_007980 [Batrachochytrium dendrobatidis]
MKFISTIVLLLLSVTVSAVVIDRPYAIESEPVKECSTHMQQHTGICASTGTEQQSTGTNHDVAQSTIDPDDSDSSVEESNELSSSSQSKQSDDDIFGNTLYDDVCHLPKKYITENERSILTPQQRLDRVEKRMRNMGIKTPANVKNEYIHKMSPKARKKMLKAKQKKRRMSSSDKKNPAILKAKKIWMRCKLAFGFPKKTSVRIVSEPTPKLKSILKPGSTSKPHSSKHGHSKKHQQKSSHDAGSREAKVHFNPETQFFEYPCESSTDDDDDEIQSIQSASDEDEIQSSPSTSNDNKGRFTRKFKLGFKINKLEIPKLKVHSKSMFGQ